MDFSLSDEQRAIRDTFRRFAQQEVRPQAADLDQSPRYPRDLILKAGELGLFSMRPAAPDGMGLDMTFLLLALEEIAWGSLAVGAACTMQALMGTTFVVRHAEGEIRQRLVPTALRGETLGAICMTEPDAGSDLGAISTRAANAEGTWKISGQKTWVTSAGVADMFTVFARTGENELSIFLVEKDAPGLHVGRDLPKSGVRASLTAEVFFEDAPATCMLGPRGGGMDALRAVLVEIRLVTSALSLGLGRAALEDSARYAAERKQFGKPINRFQAVQAHLADSRTELEAARRLVQWATWRADRGEATADQASMAKYFSSEAAWRTCERAARILASYGYSTEHPVERYLRDARFLLIGGGTSEILRGAIARGIR